MARFKYSVGLLIIVSVLTVVGGFKLYHYYFPPVNQKAVDFLFHNLPVVKDKDNFSYYLAGIFAPQEVEDIHEFGYRRYLQGIEVYKKITSLDEKTSLPEINGGLDIYDTGLSVDCWLFNVEYEDKECANLTEVKDIVRKNKILISRYKKGLNYKAFDEPMNTGPTISNYMKLQRLYLAENKLKMRERASKDLVIEVVQELRFYQDVLSSDSSLVGKAVFMVMHGASFDHLRYLITEYPKESDGLYNEIVPVLESFSESSFNVMGIFRKEFELLNAIMCLNEYLEVNTKLICHPVATSFSYASPYILNDYYKTVEPFFTILDNRINDISEKCPENDSLTSIYLYSAMHAPLYPYYTIYSLLKGGMLKGCQVFSNMKWKISRNRVLKVMLDIKKHKIKKEEILDFLKDKAYRDYFTGLPYVYDKDNHEITYPAGLPEYVYQQKFRVF